MISFSVLPDESIQVICRHPVSNQVFVLAIEMFTSSIATQIAVLFTRINRCPDFFVVYARFRE